MYVIMLVMMLIALPIEYCMSIKWFPAYFKFGIPVYYKRLINKAAILSEIDESDLNCISKSFVIGFTTPLVFKKIAEGQWAFRQQSFRNAIMHGKLFVEPGTSNVYLAAFINWYFLLITGVFIVISIQDRRYFIILAVSIVVILGYFIEKRIYDRLANYLSEEKSNQKNGN
jgi:hypothetical protein